MIVNDRGMVMNIDDGISSKRAGWSFSEDIAEMFSSHITRSIPYYEDGHGLISQLSDFFVMPDSVVYDIGCSTGAILKRLAEYHQHRPEVLWLGLDKERKMIEQAEKNCAGVRNIELFCQDVLSCDLEMSDMIVSYYTVQFIEERRRQELIDKIYQSLNWGGAFILFEKVGAPDARFQDMMSCVYREFKQHKGFTNEEILNKELSLKGVLKPFSSEGNLGLLERAGFVDIMSIFKYVCFEGFLAIK